MRFGDFHEGILQNLINRGIVKTKSEALRNAVEEYGRKYNAVDYGGIQICRGGKRAYTIDDWLKISFRGEKDLSSRIDDVAYGLE